MAHPTPNGFHRGYLPNVSSWAGSAPTSSSMTPAPRSGRGFAPSPSSSSPSHAACVGRLSAVGPRVVSDEVQSSTTTRTPVHPETPILAAESPAGVATAAAAARGRKRRLDMTDSFSVPARGVNHEMWEEGLAPFGGGPAAPSRAMAAASAPLPIHPPPAPSPFASAAGSAGSSRLGAMPPPAPGAEIPPFGSSAEEACLSLLSLSSSPSSGGGWPLSPRPQHRHQFRNRADFFPAGRASAAAVSVPGPGPDQQQQQHAQAWQQQRQHQFRNRADFVPSGRASAAAVPVRRSGPVAVASPPNGLPPPPRSGRSRSPLLYVGVTLERHDAAGGTAARLGLNVALFDGAYLVLGGVDDAAASAVTTWGWVSLQPPPPPTLPPSSLAGSVSNPASDLARFRASFSSLSPPNESRDTPPIFCWSYTGGGCVGGGGSGTAVVVRPALRRLQSGDAILSINGRAVSSFGDLDKVTTYLRKAQTLCAVAVRHVDALRAAVEARTARSPELVFGNGGTGGGGGGGAGDMIQRAAEGSFRELRRAMASARGAGSAVRGRGGVDGGAGLRRSLFGGGHDAVGGALAVVNGPRGPAARDASGTHPSGAKPSHTHQVKRAGGTWSAWSEFARDDAYHRAMQEMEEDYDPDRYPWLFIPRKRLDTAIENNFSGWLKGRKATWRRSWTVSPTALPTARRTTLATDSTSDDELEGRVEAEFWKARGFPTFQHWLAASKAQWRVGYSWNRRKRRKLERECGEEVHFPNVWDDLSPLEVEEKAKGWLRIRKKQWRILRVKRRRQLEEAAEAAATAATEVQDRRSSIETSSSSCGAEEARLSGGVGSAENPAAAGDGLPGTAAAAAPRVALAKHRSTSTEVELIDAILEDRERQEKKLESSRPPFDITFLFDASLGAPDDVIAHCLSYLHRSEHGKLLCVNWGTSYSIKQRNDMWRALCPKTWTLPRRPRKPWHALYITKIREEEEQVRKQSDEVLLRASGIVSRADHLQKMERLVESALKKFGFSVDYTSGIVLERNSLLNLAVIEQRNKIAKWLIEKKGASIETFDRGQFTPLLNAAWNGDKHMVRYLLSKGANRAKVGTGHSSQALAHPDFEGLTAEGWARKRGHGEVAELIRLGLA